MIQHKKSHMRKLNMAKTQAIFLELLLSFFSYKKGK